MSVFEMSLAAGILILFIILLRFLTMHKLRENTFVMLWKIALLRLLLPITIPAKFSMMSIINSFTERDAQIDTGKNIINTTILKGINTATNGDVIVSKHFELPVIYSIWFVGVIFFIILFFVAYTKEYNKMQMALPIENIEFIKHWLLQNVTRRNIRIMQSDRIATPITYGIISPKIVLPKTTDMNNTLQLECALSHELIHIKRFDNLWKILSIIVLCLHWFNPLVWLMYFLFNRDLEMSCDEKVISILGENEKQTYAMALIHMAEQKKGVYLLYNGFGRNAIKERIVAIMKYKKKTILGIGVSFILVLTAVNVFLAVSPDKVIESKKVNYPVNNSANTANVSDNSYELTKQINPLLNQETINAIQVYEPFGLEYSVEDDEIYYDNKVVRELFDEEEGTFIARTMGASFLEGSVDIYCIYENEELTGLRIATDDEYSRRTAERVARSEEKVSEASEVANIIALSEQFFEYQKFGLSYDEVNQKLIYEKQIVGYFKDEMEEDSYNITDTTGTIGIITVRDENNKLTGFEEVDLDVVLNESNG